MSEQLQNKAIEITPQMIEAQIELIAEYLKVHFYESREGPITDSDAQYVAGQILCLLRTKKPEFP